MGMLPLHKSSPFFLLERVNSVASLSEAAHGSSPVGFAGLSSVLLSKIHRTEVRKLESNSFMSMVIPKRTTNN